MKCQARIIREYKTRKADVQWPETYSGPRDVGSLLICGGDVKVKIKAVQQPDWGCTYPAMEIEAVCSRCRSPWWPGRIAWENKVQHWDGWDVTEVLENLK